MAIPVVEFHVRGYNIILIIQSLKYMKVSKIFIEGISMIVLVPYNTMNLHNIKINICIDIFAVWEIKLL